MSDTTLNRFLGQGTHAERLAFTPNPPTPASGPDPGYWYFETDTLTSWTWDDLTAAWVQVTSVAGFANPMTDDQDLIVGGALGVAGRLGVGAPGTVLTVGSGGLVDWAAPSGGTTIAITNDTATNASVYPTWVTANSGALPIFVTSTKLSFNPSTGLFSLANSLTSGGAVSANNFVSTGSSIPTNGWTQSSANVLSFYTNSTEALRLTSSQTMTLFGIVTWPANVRQSFAPGATVSGFNVGAHAGDPSSLVDGDIWYDSSGTLLRARINGASVSLGAGGGGGTVNSGTATQFAYYPASAAAVSSTPTVTVSSTGRLTFAPTALTSTAVAAITITLPTDTGLTGNTEVNGLLYSAADRTFADGTITNQREIVINAPTYRKTTTAVTVTTSATLAITGAPTNVAGFNAVNNYALWVMAGTGRFDGLLSAGGSAGFSCTPALTSSGAVTKVVFIQPADTGITANQEMNFLTITGGVITHANGSYAKERLVRLVAGSIGFTSAGTVTDSYTLAIDGAPTAGTGATLTQKWSLGVLTGNVQLGGQLIFLDTGQAALTSSPGISNTSGLLTLTSAGGFNLRPNGTLSIFTSLLSIANAGIFDTVFSDSTTTTTWQGAAVTGRGIYQQRLQNAANYFGLAVASAGQVSFEGNICQGTYGALTATDSGATARLAMRTYGGSTWVNNATVLLTTTQTQSESARGSKITFLQTLDGATAQTTTFGLMSDGCATFTPPARASGVANYHSIQIPADTGITASTEGIGCRHITATRTWATTGTVALQRENFFAGPTYASASASQTFTEVFNLYLTPPVQGTNAIFTRAHTLGIVDATSAASAITGALVVATTLGTAATSVGIGGGNIYAGGNITAVGSFTTQTNAGLILSSANPYITWNGSAGSQVWWLGDGIGASNGQLVLYDSTNSKKVIVVTQNTGAIQFAQYGAGSATFDASGNITAVSDERQKRNIRAFSRGLKDIVGLKPILYGYTQSSGLDQTRDDYAGFSAQQVRNFIPEAVGETPSGYLSFSDRPIIAALVNAIKELQDELSGLKSS